MSRTKELGVGIRCANIIEYLTPNKKFYFEAF